MTTTLSSHLDWDVPGYSKPSPEFRALWAREDRKFSTKTGRVPHRKRETVSGSDGVLITWKLVDGIPGLRTLRMREVLEECFRKGKDRFGFQLIGFSILDNHLHLLVIVKNDEALRKGTQGMGIRLGKAINKGESVFL